MGSKITAASEGHAHDLDLKTFEELYRRMYPTLKRYAIYLVSDVEDAQLLLNDVFIAIWKKRLLINDEKPYLFRAVKNASLNYHKRIKSPFLDLDNELVPELADQNPDPAQHYQEKDRNKMLYQLIDQMPERRRLIFYMYRIDGLSYKEIGTLLDISIRTVEDHLSKGFQFLKERIMKHEAEFR